MEQIILDPGHGSSTPGKCSPDHTLYEWFNNRDLASRVKTVAESRGLKVILTVCDNSDPKLSRRAQIANAAARDFKLQNPSNRSVFISLHSDASRDSGWGTARGFSVWTTTSKNNSDHLADSIWKAVLKKSLVWKFPMRSFTPSKPDFESNFTVIWKANCPAVLVENLFHDNQEDVALLKNPQFLNDIAEAIVTGVQDFFAQNKPRQL